MSTSLSIPTNVYVQTIYIHEPWVLGYVTCYLFSIHNSLLSCREISLKMSVISFSEMYVL